MKKLNFNQALLSGAAVAAICIPQISQAQEAQTATSADGAGLQDIIVTAQRRSERLQDVPIAVSAVTNETLTQKGIQNTLDLAQVVPGLAFTTLSGATQVRMRGVGTTNFGPGAENPVAIYIDGVYISGTSAALFDLANIERVEVLKGPQGTLFGRNATGGLVQIVTPDPSDETKGMIRFGYGNYQTATIDAYASGPVAQGVAVDFAVHYSGMGKGWGTNLNTGGDIYRQDHNLIARSKLMLQPTDALKFVITGDYSYKFGTMGGSRGTRGGALGSFEQLLTNRADEDPTNDLPLINRGGFYDANVTVDPRQIVRGWGVSLNSSWDLGGGAELKSITAYRKTQFDNRFDIEQVPQDVIGFDGIPKWKQFSEELQLNGKAGNLKYTAGLYYYNAQDSYDPFYLTLGPDLGYLFNNPPGVQAAVEYHNFVKTKSYAAYAQASYEFLPDTNLTLGGRFTHEIKELGGTQAFYYISNGTKTNLLPPNTPYADPGINPRVSYNNFSYRIALDHKITSDIMAYASYSTGFKSGGYNLTEPTNAAFKPEKLKAVEIGLKTELFDRRVRLNLSAFHYDYSNIQVNNFKTTAPVIINAATAKIDGVEAELDARIVPGLTLSGSVAYTDHRFTSFPGADYYRIVPGCDTTGGTVDFPCKADAKGNRLPGSPVFTGNIGLNYEANVGQALLGFTSNLYHSSGFYGSFDNDPRALQAAYNVVNGSIYFEPKAGGVRFTVWGKNLFAEKYVTNYYISSQASNYEAAAPRTYGVTAEMKF